MSFDHIQQPESSSISPEKAREIEDLYRVERPKGRSHSGILFGVAVTLVLLGIGLYLYWSYYGAGIADTSPSTHKILGDQSSSGNTLIDPNAWYAVHLVDGKVYYGRFLGSDLASLTLEDVFYSSSDTQGTTTASSTPSGSKLVLVKLGTEAHRPEDRIVVGQEALLFFEKLKEDSPVVRAIEEYLER